MSNLLMDIRWKKKEYSNDENNSSTFSMLMRLMWKDFRLTVAD